MTIKISIPKTPSEVLSLEVPRGACLFLLGANGSGKSALVQHIFKSSRSKDSQNKVIKISAHRQTWFSSDSLNMSPQSRNYIRENVQQSDAEPKARWRDEYAEGRVDAAIYDIIQAENLRARTITSAVDSKQSAHVEELSSRKSIIKIINELLRLSNIQVEISLADDEQVVASKDGGRKYSVAMLSDGERNALLIAANVLTAPKDALLILDEPEKHLHRSIISPLLSELFKERPDCSFVVSTHDIDLVLESEKSQKILVRDCLYNQGEIESWDLDLIPPHEDIDDILMHSILGARRTLLFIEGNGTTSLDKPLYSLLFPNVSVVAKGSCRDVEHAVTGIQSSTSLHWLRAFGIIDNDNRSGSDVVKLAEKGIYSLNVHSVEALYYNDKVIEQVAKRQANVTGEDPYQLVESSRAAALQVLGNHSRRMSVRAVEKSIREDLDSHWPTIQDIDDGRPVSIDIDVSSKVEDETAVFERLLSEKKLDQIISRYPLRETPALDKIAKGLGFANRSKYESSVIKLLADEPTVLAELRALFGDLVNEIYNNSSS